MSFLKSFFALSPRTRMAVGVATLAWGAAGLYLSDAAADRMGMRPTAEEQAALDRMTPKIHVVDRGEPRSAK